MNVVLPWKSVPIVMPLYVIVLFISGCAFTSPPPPHSSAPCETGLPFAMSAKLSDSASFAQEAEKWQSVAQTAEGLSERAQAHLHLAALFLNHENPNESPHQAYRELVKAIKVWPDLENDIAVASWLGLLARHEALTADFAKERVDFENELAADRRLIKSLGVEINTLNEKLEKLKRAEMVVERKRRAFK